MSNYNFVILGVKNDIFKISFKDVVDGEAVRYIDDDLSQWNAVYRFAHKLHFSCLLNKYFRLPLKRIWNARKISISVENEKPVCFIIFSNWISAAKEIKLIPYLRKKYPNCKLVWFAQDIVKTIHNWYTDDVVNVNKLKQCLDLIVSFDMNDACKYELEYHPTVLSKIPLPVDDKYQGDVFFIGKSKKRLDLLIDISKGFRKYGVVCNFMVYGVPLEEQREPEFIRYINKPLTYYENLMYVKNSKCLLELMQPDAVGYTFRTSEALLYNKKLITNNRSINQAPFYNSNGIVVLTELTESFFEQTAKKILEKNPIQYENCESVTPKHLLDFIEKKITYV